jgi:hypothetical protein
MKFTVKQLKNMIAEHVINEADEFAFKVGSIATLIRPVRVTPRPDGKWGGGEDSPLSRRGPRPRGSTSTILKPGTECRINRAGKNQAWCTPLDTDGGILIDPQTGREIDNVLIHVNKFSQSAADLYKQGKPKIAPTQTKPEQQVSPQQRLEQLKATVQRLQNEIDKLERVDVGLSNDNLPD